MMAKLGADHFRIELLEEHPAGVEVDLVARESEWIKKVGTPNYRDPGRTHREWNYTLVHCECGHSYRNYNRTKHIRTQKHLAGLRSREKEEGLAEEAAATVCGACAEPL